VEKKAILLVNLGTPARPDKIAVRQFLSEFLNDPKVIDIPYIARKILVNLIIVPLRAGKSTKMYKKIWTDKGSPILIHSKNLLEKLDQNKVRGTKYFLAMRYGNPSLESVFKEIQSENFDKIIILPLFPQFANSTTGSVKQKCEEISQKLPLIPEIRFIENFYNHPAFINVWINRLKLLRYQDFEHIIFVFHGLPIRQVEQTHSGKTCEELQCQIQISDDNSLCYRAHCYHNTRILTSTLKIKEPNYTLCFQSRFGKNWLGPFADKVIEEKAKIGIKSMLVVPLSFVADCLETKLEIEIEYARLFKNSGGENLIMSESLNSGIDWVETVAEIVKEKNKET
jgi:protoporphyrin/coproporphyrin ferrochelatase